MQFDNLSHVAQVKIREQYPWSYQDIVLTGWWRDDGKWKPVGGIHPPRVVEQLRVQKEECARLRGLLEKERQISARRSSDVKMLLKQLEEQSKQLMLYQTIWSEKLGD